ncbi:MAG: DNA-3-methyladenine glycosylase I [Minisyncoccia bacterium]
MNKKRCQWAEGKNAAYMAYHDTEWGVPVYDDRKLFEFVVLEGAQAGLSWETILNRCEGYRKAFKKFDPKKVAKMTQGDVEALMQDSGIIRNKLKINSTITNAQAFLLIQKEFGSFSNYMWSYVHHKPLQNKLKLKGEIPIFDVIASELSKDLKRRGFKFFGPTICYAHMQAVGMVNDHTIDCFRHREVRELYAQSPTYK